jgi:hypothetical protein
MEMASSTKMLALIYPLTGTWCHTVNSDETFIQTALPSPKVAAETEEKQVHHILCRNNQESPLQCVKP